MTYVLYHFIIMPIMINKERRAVYFRLLISVMQTTVK